ncbi:MAG: hypothetical protein LBS99_02700 [Clostridiales bacterium]|nr:hypothetical protein [Clostridiales bacterium]
MPPIAAPLYGEAKNSWLTGTASWTMVAASQSILGIYPDYDGLRIEPCLPKSMTRCLVTRKYRGNVYNIEIINGGGRAKPIVFINGKKQGDSIISIHNTEVVSG